MTGNRGKPMNYGKNTIRSILNTTWAHQLNFFKENFYSKTLDFFFPQPCVYCESKRVGGGPCQGAIDFISSSYCNLCGIPANLAYESCEGKFLCGSCRSKLPSFDKARSLGLHQGVLRKLVHEFKYGARS
jgi:predicted amidophosphoribosyltransferase